MKFTTKKLVTLAMLAAVAYIVSLFQVSVFPAPMDFLKLEAKDSIIAMAGFFLDPLSAFFISLVVSLIEMITISTSGPIGALMNTMSTCAFACTAAFIYKRRHKLSGALIGLILGSIAMTVAMLLWNWLITPLYQGWPRSVVEAALIPYFLPFNALKAGLNTALTMFLYKPLVNTLRKIGLLEKSSSSSAPGGSKLGFYLVAAAVLVSCVLGCLVLMGIL
jgi:riboflavin transporter FmnP